jgi:uncharacterized SAM-binding protein YcdF (DUF218 family)
MACVVVGFLADRVVVEKVLTQLALPYGMTWILVGLLALVAYARQNRFATWTLFIGWVAIYIAGNSYLARLGIRYLEQDYVQHELKDDTLFDTIVVLGGGATVRPNSTPQLNFSGDRIMTALRMYKHGMAKKIVCTGSRIAELDRVGFDQSQAAMDILIEAGIPESVVTKIGGRNTSEEMQTLGTLFQKSDKVGLITSAWHLPRAMRLANAQGFHPTAIPADYRSPPIMTPTIVDFVPCGEGAFTMQLFTKECLAKLVGR